MSVTLVQPQAQVLTLRKRDRRELVQEISGYLALGWELVGEIHPESRGIQVRYVATLKWTPPALSSGPATDAMGQAILVTELLARVQRLESAMDGLVRRLQNVAS